MMKENIQRDKKESEVQIGANCKKMKRRNSINIENNKCMIYLWCWIVIAICERG